MRRGGRLVQPKRHKRQRRVEAALVGCGTSSAAAALPEDGGLDLPLSRQVSRRAFGQRLQIKRHWVRRRRNGDFVRAIGDDRQVSRRLVVRGDAREVEGAVGSDEDAGASLSSARGAVWLAFLRGEGSTSCGSGGRCRSYCSLLGGCIRGRRGGSSSARRWCTHEMPRCASCARRSAAEQRCQTNIAVVPR